MRTIDYRIWAAVLVALLVSASCKPKEEAVPSQQVGTMSPSEIAAVRDAMTRGMNEVAFESLGAAHIKKHCVVVARTPNQAARADSSPPPLGMVRRLGRTTIYKGEIQNLSSESLRICAPYPTSGQQKVIEIPRADIQAVYLAK